MDAFEIKQSEGRTGARILTVIGSLTLQSVFEFQNLIRRDQPADLIIDLGEAPYMDSAGLGAILGAYTSCGRNGRRFGLVHVAPRVLTLLQVAGVDKLVPQYETVEASGNWLPRPQSSVQIRNVDPQSQSA